MVNSIYLHDLKDMCFLLSSNIFKKKFHPTIQLHFRSIEKKILRGKVGFT